MTAVDLLPVYEDIKLEKVKPPPSMREIRQQLQKSKARPSVRAADSIVGRVVDLGGIYHD